MNSSKHGFLHTAALPDDEEGDASNTASAAGPTAAEAAAATALASILRTSCTIIDMGSFLLTDVRSRPYTADDAALPCIAGEHVRQILPEALVERAASFPPFDRLSQVRTITQTSTHAGSDMPANCLWHMSCPDVLLAFQQLYIKS